MSYLVSHGALLKCTFSLTVAPLSVLPLFDVEGDTLPLATIMDCVPGLNLPPFGMCMSFNNPQVQAASAAAGGTLVPQPCVPVPISAWDPTDASVVINSLPVLNNKSRCKCAWSGVISIVSPMIRDIVDK